MNCKNCNAEMKEGALFCQECGAKVGDDLPETSLKCAKCGAELEPGIKFCSQCGTVVTDGQTENTTGDLAEVKDGAENNVYAGQTNDLVMKAKSKIKKKPKYFGAIGIVVLIFGCCFFNQPRYFEQQEQTRRNFQNGKLFFHV